MTDETPPDRRKHGYAELEAKLEEHAAEIEDRLHAFFSKALIIMAVIGLTSALGIFGFGYALSRIQSARKEFVRSTCEAQNKHHDDTSKQVIDLYATRPETSANITRRNATLALIDALAPRQNCDLLVKIAVGDVDPPKTATEGASP